MRTALALVTALGLVLSAGSAGAKPPATGAAASTPSAGGYTLDAKGKCRDASGKMAKKTMCAGASTTGTAKAPSASAAGAPAAATATTSSHDNTMAAAKTPGTKGAPHCKTGKPCGNACIAQNQVCHKQ